jgi:hypothetical protein
MAKALIAAVLLAVVLVAAVVVPLVVMPDVSGFDEWPKATPRPPHEQIVTISVPAPAKRAIVRSEPSTHRVAPQRQLAQAPASAPARTPRQHVPEPQKRAAEEPPAAPEAPLPPPVVDARDNARPEAIGGEAQADDAVDGTNAP